MSPMRAVLAVLLFVSSGVAASAAGHPPIGSASSGGDVPVVRIMVPVRSMHPAEVPDTAVARRLGWTVVEVPAPAGTEAALQQARAAYGPDAYLAVSFTHMGPQDEPLFDSQWYFRNTGQTDGTNGADVNAMNAWDDSTGAGMVVAIVDSGINIAHPDLAGQQWVNPGEVANGTDSDGNGYVDDIRGYDFHDDDPDPSPGGFAPDMHGTAVAGLVAAKVNGLGIAGLSPDARLMDLRVCSNNDCPSDFVAEAIVYAVDMGADVINVSLGAPAAKVSDDPVTFLAYDYARAHDVPIVTAAGNLRPDQLQSGWTIIPGAYPHSNNLAVTATDHHDQLTSFSYWGSTVDIAAPGKSIITTFHPSGHAFVDGTSFSAPLASAAAALLIAATPNLTHHEVIGRLKDFARKVPALDGKVESGRLDAGMALSHRFADSVNHLFESEITWLAGQGITKGCNPPSNTRYCPNDRVTRGQMAAFLKRTFSYPATSEDFFDDDNGNIFEADINAVAKAGVTRGCNPPANTMFCPGGFVTRGQMAAFLRRALGLPAASKDFFDDDNGSIFEGDINALAEAGITRGCNPPANDMFCPDQFVTRGQMAAFIKRASDS
jgi:subtilisin family serine protease